MRRLGIASVPIFFMVTACVHRDLRPPEASAEPTEAPAAAHTPDNAPLPPAKAETAPAAGVSTGSMPAAAAPVPSPAPAPANAPGPKQPRSASSRPSAPVVKTPVPATTPSPAAAPPNAATTPALDLKTLEQRLRDTHAIGVFTKLSLKNQVDDLLAQFKTFYGGHSQITLVQLRQKYEVLLMKVVSVLQDDDPQLASTISSSREAIWNVLADPKSFANI
jgi:hypothetical protein